MMGYSCTVDASNTMGVIGRTFATDGNPNFLTIKGRKFFFERGRENVDGAITGTLMKELPNNFCRKAGTVRIEGNGTLTRFPYLSAVERKEIENTMRDMAARNPQLLRSWSMGRLSSNVTT